MNQIIAWYDQNAGLLKEAYEAVPAITGQQWLADLLPKAPAIVVDIGAGTGRDARAFAAIGYDAIAVEPSAMRSDAGTDGSPRVRWIPDSLPALEIVTRSRVAADVVLLNATWQHVALTDRTRAFRKLVGLLRSGGLLVFTLRHGPATERGDHPTSAAEIAAFGRDHGMQVLWQAPAADPFGRPDVSWTNMVLRLPDDGTGALPLLRHLILNDAKSATYKIGLLRALCRAADGSAGLADDGEDEVTLPLGLVALIWLQLYWPLVAADLPQSPGNRLGGDGLGFAGPGWRALVSGAASRRDLRIGVAFAGAAAQAVRAALREAADHICRMPANFLTVPGGDRLLKIVRLRTTKPTSSLVLNPETLASFGLMRVPRHVWVSMQRFATWIEPALVAEWTRLIRNYAAGQGRAVEPGTIEAAMTWAEPDRDVGVARNQALRIMDDGMALHCVWSGKRLRADNLDVDHCSPWAAWPCGDLWNLMPADRRVNQAGKRDRLPSATALDAAAGPIVDWWTAAYLRPDDIILPRRFALEARASLSALSPYDDCGPEQIHAAVAVQRVRLARDQGVPEWGWGADR